MAGRFFGIDVTNCVAVARDIAIEPPRVAQRLVQVECVGAHRNPVHRIVTAHDSFDATLHHTAFERVQFIIDRAKNIVLSVMWPSDRLR